MKWKKKTKILINITFISLFPQAPVAVENSSLGHDSMGSDLGSEVLLGILIVDS